jgi:hypothetical protein
LNPWVKGIRTLTTNLIHDVLTLLFQLRKLLVGCRDAIAELTLGFLFPGRRHDGAHRDRTLDI